MRVAVLGCGLAGVTAALAARAAGAEVVAVGRAPGASALWSGVVELFGPIYDAVVHQDPLGGPHLQTVGRPPQEDRRARYDRLLRRRSFHPYARLSLAVEEVERLARRAAEPLGLDLAWSEGADYVPNVHGTVRLADAADGAVWPGRLTAERRYVAVGFEHYPTVSPESVAGALEAQGVRAGSAWVSLPHSPGLAQSPAQAAAQLEALEDGALGELGQRLAMAAGDGIALVPPILGRTPDACTRIRNLIAKAAPTLTVAELASVHQSLHGFRLHRRLQTALRDGGVTVHAEPVSRVERLGRRVEALELANGNRIGLDALVLATGRGVGGGLGRGRPLAESLLDLPLYLEGAPVTAYQHPPELTTRRLFDDQPLMVLGVGVSTDLRPLDEDGRPACDNVWAAGLLLGGTNFTRDGSAFGVALVTGERAGRAAAGREDA